MSFWHDRQIRKYWYFMFGVILLSFLLGIIIVMIQTRQVQQIVLARDNAMVTSLIEQGIPGEVIAAAIAGTKRSQGAAEFLSAIGRTEQTSVNFLPYLSRFRHTAGGAVLVCGFFLSTALFAGAFLFFRKREQLYRQAVSMISGFMEGDYSRHMPQSREGTVFHLFASIEQLATMLQAKNESERKGKEFLKSTISDISHQLKTPLAALMMYQEIVEGEPDHPDTVKEFAVKMRISLKRIEHLISSMLKIARLDVGNIEFEKKPYQISELLLQSVSELTARAENERKNIVLEGALDETVVCDLEWTREAVGNIVKNALDHTTEGGMIRISCYHSPFMARIMIEDNGHGISEEEIHHIFKRFYRSKDSFKTQGVGLGLPLAKSIIEGQGGTISVQSEENAGTTFTVSLLTKS